MKKKINQLIVISISGLMALSVIQAYLVNNTYKLKKEAFINETRSSISDIDDISPALDSLSDLWKDYFINKVTEYKFNIATKEEVIQGLQLVVDSVNGKYKSEYQNELIGRNIPYGIKFHKKVLNIIILDSIKNDTIFNNKSHEVPIVLGNDIIEKNEIPISNTQWQTDHTTSKLINGETREINYNLLVQTRDVMDIEGWKNIVFKQMIGILALSVFIFITVIGLLYYSIKSYITEKKVADVKTDFVNNITHELKTPLATLTLATKMLKKDKIKQQPKLLNDTINTIERQNQRLQKLIDEVLNNSLGYQDIKLNKESVKIEEYMTSVLNDFQLSVKSKDVTVFKTFTTKHDVIALDKFFITTALFNILENAVKYSGDKVTIKCNIESDTELKISINDNGIGISGKDKAQVFDKFFRAGNKEIHNVKGLGLGLYYTNQIIKAHNGNIKFSSEKGKGSTFILSIPFN